MYAGIWLSILLPVYNVECYLADCLSSILKQAADYQGIEIIILDDASTDDSRKVAASIADVSSNQIKLVFHSQNLGVSAARNRLIEEARGQYIWFIDPDDYLLDGAISRLRGIIAAHNPDLILCDYSKHSFGRKRSFFGTSKQLAFDKTRLLAGVFQSRKLYCWLKISRRSLWSDGLRFPVGKVFEDVTTIPWLLLRAKSYYYMPKAWVHYRRRSGSIMDSVRRQRDIFDERKHQDLAEALIGFKEHLPTGANNANRRMEYYLANFCAKEFIKTSFRLMRSKRYTTDPTDALATLRSLLDIWQTCSPISFEQLALEYGKRFSPIRYAILRYFLRLTAPLVNDADVQNRQKISPRNQDQPRRKHETPPARH